jgi:hypothetical protein
MFQLPTDAKGIRLLADMTAHHGQRIRSYLSLVYSLCRVLVPEGFTDAVLDIEKKRLILFQYGDAMSDADDPWTHVAKALGLHMSFTVEIKTKTVETKKTTNFRDWCKFTDAHILVSVPDKVPMGLFSVMFEGNWQVAAHALFGTFVRDDGGDDDDDYKEDTLEITLVLAAITATKYKPNCFVYCCEDKKKRASLLMVTKGHPETCHLFLIGGNNKIIKTSALVAAFSSPSSRVQRSFLPALVPCSFSPSSFSA